MVLLWAYGEFARPTNQATSLTEIHQFVLLRAKPNDARSLSPFLRTQLKNFQSDTTLRGSPPKFNSPVEKNTKFCPFQRTTLAETFVDL